MSHGAAQWPSECSVVVAGVCVVCECVLGMLCVLCLCVCAYTTRTLKQQHSNTNMAKHGANGKHNDTSPQTNLPLAHKHLVPNITLRNAIGAFREANPEQT